MQFDCLLRGPSTLNESLNSESLIMSVLIIKRELLGTKQLKSNCQMSLQRQGKERKDRVYSKFPLLKYPPPPPSLIGCAVVTYMIMPLHCMCVSVHVYFSDELSEGHQGHIMKPKAHAAAAAYRPRLTCAQHTAATHTNHTHIWSTDMMDSLPFLLFDVFLFICLNSFQHN